MRDGCLDVLNDLTEVKDQVFKASLSLNAVQGNVRLQQLVRGGDAMGSRGREMTIVTDYYPYTISLYLIPPQRGPKSHGKSHRDKE
eukprot:scaffold3148_cov212-Ochromonas_danica.AAC.1